MFICPNCHQSLEFNQYDSGPAWECPTCLYSMAFLQKMTNIPCLQDWQLETDPLSGPSPCPSCFNTFQTVSIPVDPGSVTTQYCSNCQVLWLSPSVRSILRKPHARADTDALSPPTPLASTLKMSAGQTAAAALSPQEKKGIIEAQMIAAQMNHKYKPNRPEHWWEYILAFLGFPVRAGNSRIAFPWMTYTIIGITCIISIIAWFAPDFTQIVRNFGMTPATIKYSFGLTLLTSFFLHANFMHLLGNMYFLGLFGGKTEHNLGRLNFLLLIASATLVGHVAQIMFDPRLTMPSIGASGGISGVIVFYCLKFPKDKFYQLLYFRFIRVSAFFYMAVWILLQLIGAGRQLAGSTNVSSLAHLGGSLVGLLCALSWKVEPEAEQDNIFKLDQ